MRHLLACLALALPGPILAQTTAANIGIVANELGAACPAGDGRVTGGVVERDFTGDGVLDLLVDHGRLTCGTSGESARCSDGLCAVRLWINEGGRMVLAQELRARNIRVSSDTPPTVTAFVGGGSSGTAPGSGAVITFTWQTGVFR